VGWEEGAIGSWEVECVGGEGATKGKRRGIAGMNGQGGKFEKWLVEMKLYLVGREWALRTDGSRAPAAEEQENAREEELQVWGQGRGGGGSIARRKVKYSSEVQNWTRLSLHKSGGLGVSYFRT
jgi:endonuclease YncB( thermonuclease family)